MNKKISRWAIALAYVLFIYATLEVVRVPTNFLRRLGVLRLTLNFSYVAVSLILVALAVIRQRSFSWRIPAIIGLLLIYPFTAPLLATPEEQIHFVEYGVVGILFLRALTAGDNAVTGLRLLYAWGLATAAGWVDELIQGVLPSRHYDLNDVLLNCFSAFLGLTIFLIFHRKKSDLKES